jgi:hypothetical protein
MNITVSPAKVTYRVRPDRRLTFLLRASAQFALVEKGIISLQQAMEELEPAMLELTNCRCYWEIYDALGRRKRGAPWAGPGHSVILSMRECCRC